MKDQLVALTHPYNELQIETNLDGTDFRNKPKSAFWTSTARPYCEWMEDGSERYYRDRITSEWHDWTLRENFGVGYYGYLIRVKESAKIYDIRSRDDLDALPKEVDGNPIFPLYFFKDEKDEKPSGPIDFKKVAEMGYDAIHLHEKAAYELHQGIMNSWDVESTVWLTGSKAFESVEPLLISEDMEYFMKNEA